ncbi:hypothetical protein WJX84_003900 [Apatococcus fuscideae]|uniref:Uncharacterized protein n=1 Tax=Apatococcus fuscideae TaxID=2026836 RepID=A0AAW1RKU9_9CHLO
MTSAQAAFGKDAADAESTWQIGARHQDQQNRETSPILRLKQAVKSRHSQPIQLSAVALECRQQHQWKQTIEVLEGRVDAAEKRSDDFARANKRLRTQAEKTEKEIHVAQGKAETLAGCLAAAEAKRKVAEENLKRLEIRMGQGRQGLALLKAAKLQTERNAARHQASDISEQMAQLTEQAARAEEGQAELQRALSEAAKRHGLATFEPLLELTQVQQKLQQAQQHNQSLERELKISKQQAAIADEEARAGLPLRSQLQEVSARVLELEALQRQADEDKGDLLDYIQELEGAQEAAGETSRDVPELQDHNLSHSGFRALEAEAAALRRDKHTLEGRLGDCQGRLEAAQQQLRSALTTQQAAQSRLDQLQQDMLQLQRMTRSDRPASASPAKPKAPGSIQPEVSHPDAESFEKLKTERDTAASQLTLLAARTEDLLRENRNLTRQGQHTKGPWPQQSEADERCAKLEDQVAAAREQVGSMTSQNERLLEQVRLLEQKAYEAEVALEEQHEAAQALLEGSSDDQEAPGASGNMIEGLKAQVKTLNEEKQGLQRQLVDACTHNTKQNLLRSEQQCAALEEENTALSDSLASQARALTTEALEDAAHEAATSSADHAPQHAESSHNGQSTRQRSEDSLPAEDVPNGRRPLSVAPTAASDVGSSRSDGTLHEKLHGLQANFKQMRMRYQSAARPG